VYDANTQHIPPIGTEVWVRLKPVLDEGEGDVAPAIENADKGS